MSSAVADFPDRAPPSTSTRHPVRPVAEVNEEGEGPALLRGEAEEAAPAKGEGAAPAGGVGPGPACTEPSGPGSAGGASLPGPWPEPAGGDPPWDAGPEGSRAPGSPS